MSVIRPLVNRVINKNSTPSLLCVHILEIRVVRHTVIILCVCVRERE